MNRLRSVRLLRLPQRQIATPVAALPGSCYARATAPQPPQMSALPPSATEQRTLPEVREVPQADVAVHSITSSARASNVAGTSRPRALAVLRLIVS